MNTNYNADRVGCQTLLAVCKRNLDKLDNKDREIVYLEAKRFYGSGRRGQKRKDA